MFTRPSSSSHFIFAAGKRAGVSLDQSGVWLAFPFVWIFPRPGTAAAIIKSSPSRRSEAATRWRRRGSALGGCLSCSSDVERTLTWVETQLFLWWGDRSRSTLWDMFPMPTRFCAAQFPPHSPVYHNTHMWIDFWMSSTLQNLFSMRVTLPARSPAASSLF